MALIFTSNNIVLGNAGATVTLTHGLGVAPDFTTVSNRSNTGSVSVFGSTSQVVYLAGTLNAINCDCKVESFHSIIK